MITLAALAIVLGPCVVTSLLVIRGKNVEIERLKTTLERKDSLLNAFATQREDDAVELAEKVSRMESGLAVVRKDRDQYAEKYSKARADLERIHSFARHWAPPFQRNLNS